MSDAALQSLRDRASEQTHQLKILGRTTQLAGKK
jgi:hypothetical protein